MTYNPANDAKTTFDDLYTTPTPHNYFRAMAKHGYAIGEEAKPYFQSAVRLLQERTDKNAPTRLLDLGCSYGVGAALIKHRLSFFDIMDFFNHEAPHEYERCVDSTRLWLEERAACNDVECVGADSSAQAIKFATDSGLIDNGIAHNFEGDPNATAEEIRIIEGCNLLISTGAIGYVGEKTLSILLRHLGKADPEQEGPYAIMTILRVFDPEPIQDVFERFGFKFGIVPSIHLRQRRFTDATEQNETLSLLNARGVSPAGLEEEGLLFADLYVAAPPERFEMLRDEVAKTRIRRSAHSALKEQTASM